jgi:predicted ATPase
VPRVISFEYEFSFAEDGKSYRVAVDRLDAVVKSGASQKHVIGGFIPALNGILARTRQTSISDLMKQIGSPGGAPPPVLRAAMENVRLYREFHTGPDSNTRRGIAASALGDYLSEDGGNLALVLSKFELNGIKPKVVQILKQLYEPFEEVVLSPLGGIAQLYVREAGMTEPMSALSLSDGTLRLLCLLAIWLEPEPPPLVCIEEPEIGLHPDAIRIVGDLLRDAAERTQLIVTTHSPALVDALSDQPESVVVCERDFDGFTQFRRLKSAGLDDWLERYSLGELWQKGELGGNRW